MLNNDKQLFIFVFQITLNMRHIISKSNLRFFLIPILLLLILIQCDDNETPFPNVSIYVTISLDTQLGNMGVGSYKFFDGHGVGGLIIYRKDFNVFQAFDRACRHEASGKCVVETDADYQEVLVCPCCDSEYWMTVQDLAGTIKQGPAKAPLKQYNCTFDGINTVDCM